MSKQLKRILSLVLVLAMILSVMPTVLAEGSRVSGEANAAKPISARANEIVEADVFAAIAELEAEAAHPMGGQSRMTEADYVNLVPQVKRVIMNSETYVPGTLQANGNFLVWQTTVGIPCCYDPRM